VLGIEDIGCEGAGAVVTGESAVAVRVAPCLFYVDAAVAVVDGAGEVLGVEGEGAVSCGEGGICEVCGCWGGKGEGSRGQGEESEEG